jgi:hypothetical protein
MSIFGQVKRPFQWVGRKTYNTWFWARREASLRQLFDICPDGSGRKDDYPSDKFKDLLSACGMKVKHRGTYDGCDITFGKKSQYFSDWPRGELVNVIIICDVRDFLISVGVREPKDIYTHLHSA